MLALSASKSSQKSVQSHFSHLHANCPRPWILVEGGGRDSAWRNRAPGPHAHRNTARQATDGLWTEARGQQKQSNDPGNNQHILNTPIIGRR